MGSNGTKGQMNPGEEPAGISCMLNNMRNIYATLASREKDLRMVLMIYPQHVQNYGDRHLDESVRVQPNHRKGASHQ